MDSSQALLSVYRTIYYILEFGLDGKDCPGGRLVSYLTYNACMGSSNYVVNVLG